MERSGGGLEAPFLDQGLGAWLEGQGALTRTSRAKATEENTPSSPLRLEVLALAGALTRYETATKQRSRRRDRVRSVAPF